MKNIIKKNVWWKNTDIDSLSPKEYLGILLDTNEIDENMLTLH